MSCGRQPGAGAAGLSNRAVASPRAACAAAGPLGQKLAGLVKDGGRSERLDCSRIERRPGCHTWPRNEKRKTQRPDEPLAPVLRAGEVAGALSRPSGLAALSL